MNKYPLFLLSAEMRPWLTLFLIIDVILKGISLYKSARKNQTVWFVALLLVNSLGVLPLIYLLIDNVSGQKTANVVAIKKVVKTTPKTKKKTRK